jgi:hypothetical protein
MACHGVISAALQRRNRLLDQAGDYAAFIFQPLPLRHLKAGRSPAPRCRGFCQRSPIQRQLITAASCCAPC